MSNFVVATNIQAMNAYRNLKSIGGKNIAASEKLSSGVRINRAADDAAGLAISEKMKSQIRGMKQAQRNTEDGINVCNTMDGGMSGIQEMMTRQRELIIQALNDTNTEADRAKIQLEIDQLTLEIGATADRTEFNGINLLNRSGIVEKTPIYDTITMDVQVPVYRTEYRYTMEVVNNQISYDVYDPPVDNNGRFNFFALNADNQATQMLYGDSNPTSNSAPSTSYPAIRINTSSGTYEYGIWSSAARPNGMMAYVGTDDTTPGVWESTFRMQNPATGLDFDVIQRISVVEYGQDKTDTVSLPAPDGTDLSGTYTYWDGGQSYRIEYEVINNGTEDFTFDFMYNVDTTIGGNDGSPFVEPGTSTALNSATWEGNQIPDSLWMYNSTTNPLINVELTFKDTNNFSIDPESEPDKVSIGAWGNNSAANNVSNFNYVGNGTSIGDTAYSVIWNNRDTGAVDSAKNVLLNWLNDTNMLSAIGNLVASSPALTAHFTNVVDRLSDLRTAISNAASGSDVDNIISTELNNVRTAVSIAAAEALSNGTITEQAHISIVKNIVDTGYNWAEDSLRAIKSAYASNKMVTYFGVTSPPPEVLATIGDVAEYQVIDHYVTQSVTKDALVDWDEKKQNEQLWIQCGGNGGQGIFIDLYDCRPEALYEDVFDPATFIIDVNGVPTEVTLTELVTQPWEEAMASLSAIDTAFDKVNDYRAKAGAQQNRLGFVDNSLAVSFTNLEEANSRIADTDMAKEMMNLTKTNILQQAGVSMLTQANQSPQSILELLG